MRINILILRSFVVSLSFSFDIKIDWYFLNTFLVLYCSAVLSVLL